MAKKDTMTNDEIIDSLNKTFMGITFAVVTVTNKNVGDSMIKAWEEALKLLKT